MKCRVDMRQMLFSFSIIFIMLSPLSADDMTQAASKGIVVVELFTSQGCSSCPPADQFLSSLLRVSNKNNFRVYALTFHVDYWNHLGWEDSFSALEYSDRQRAYAQVYRWKTVFTPQVIINGQYSLQGNDTEAITKRLNRLLRVPARVVLTLKLKELKENKIRVAYSVDKLLSHLNLNLALVENGLNVEITAGENTGLKSTYDNVVRTFKSYPLKDKEGVFEVALNPQVQLKNAYIIGFVQDKMMFVYAADKVQLN